MLRHGVVFLVAAIIAALFGFGGYESSATAIAKVLSVVFLLLFLFTLF